MTQSGFLTRSKAIAAALIGTILVLLSFAAASPEAKPKKKKQGTPLAEQFDVRTVAAGFERSISFDYLPNGTLLVAEKRGYIYRVNPDGGRTLLLDLSATVQNERERGLEGIAVASDFDSSRRVYFVYTYRVNPLRPSGPQALRLSYFQLDSNANVINPAAPETVVLGKDATKPCPAITNKLDCPASIDATHQGGTVLSAPDGTLWVGYGDSNLPQSRGNQVFRTFDPRSTAGKLLHVDADGNGLEGHPFCKKTKNLTRTCTKVYARGFRNPFRFVLTPGGRPLVADVGWNEREEINLVKKGGNYGWPCMEGSTRTPFYRDRGRCKTLYRKPRKLNKPIYEYRNNSATGAAVIMGPQHQSPSYPPGLDGAYFFGDYANQFIKEGVLRKGKLKGIRTVATGVLPVQFRVAPNGNISFVDFLAGTINELVYAPNKAPHAVASASPRAYCPPASATTVGFSSSGTSDPEGDALSYQWDFDSNGSVDSTAANPSHVYATNGRRTATLRVSDGTSTSAATVTVYAGDCPPSATVTSLSPDTRFRIGTPVPLQANGSDPDDTLSASSFRWDVVLVHKGHKHEVGTFIGTATEFNPVADHDADSYYEVTLSVADPSGFVLVKGPYQVHPETVRLRLRTNIGKVKLSYGGRTIKTPRKFRAAIGFKANLSAPRRVTKGGRTYRFKRWSVGGRRNRVFTIPAKKAKIVAKYRLSG